MLVIGLVGHRVSLVSVKSTLTLHVRQGVSVNFFPTHRTLWDDRKFFPSRCVSHWWTISTASFVDASYTGVRH